MLRTRLHISKTAFQKRSRAFHADLSAAPDSQVSSRRVRTHAYHSQQSLNTGANWQLQLQRSREALPSCPVEAAVFDQFFSRVASFFIHVRLFLSVVRLCVRLLSEAVV